jgi:hypothetical protein
LVCENGIVYLICDCTVKAEILNQERERKKNKEVMVMDRFCDICVDNNFFDVVVEEKKSVDEYCWCYMNLSICFG